MIYFRSTLRVIGIFLVGLILASCGGGSGGDGVGDEDGGKGTDVTDSAEIALPATGQTECYDTTGVTVDCAGTGQDGELRAGVSLPAPRFTDNEDGTVQDNLTGLVWLKNAKCFDEVSWTQALSYSNKLDSGNCGLTDGSVVGDWRLPNLRELLSLVNFSKSGPPITNTAGTAILTPGDPFNNVQSYHYWTSTTNATADEKHKAWYVGLWKSTNLTSAEKDELKHVWPVRN